MFETMQSFFAFFFPVLALIVAGILFEEKLVALEQRILQTLRRQSEAPARQRLALQKVERKTAGRAARSRTNRAA